LPVNRPEIPVFATGKVERKPSLMTSVLRTVVVSIANELARIAWAVAGYIYVD